MSGQGSSKHAVSARPVEVELARRIERVVARAAEELRWKATERTRRQERLSALLAHGAAKAGKLAEEIERLADKLARPAGAREAHRLSALVRIRARAQSPREIRELLAEMVEVLKPAIPFEGATAFVFEKDAARLSPVVVAGSHVDLIPDIHFDCGAGFSSWVAKTKRPVLLSSFREDPIGVPLERPASFLSVPLLVEDDLAAVLNFAHHRPGTFTTADRDLVLLAGRLAAPSLVRPTSAAAWTSGDVGEEEAFTTRTA